MVWTNETEKDRRNERSEKGLCTSCGKKRGSKGTTKKCRPCVNKQNEQAAKYKLRKELGITKKVDKTKSPWVLNENCRICREPLEQGRTTQRCEKCASIVNDAAVVKKLQRHEDNLCQNCGKDKPITRGKYHLCYKCYLRAAACRHLGSTSRWKELRDLWEKQKGICPYTGKQLTIGVDASVDHIFPHSRYPELKNNISNIEWIDFKINLMKRDLTKDEFIAILKQIVNRTEN